MKLRLDYLVKSLNKTMATATTRFRLLESFMYTAEQFIQMTSNGENVLDFSGSLAGWTATFNDIDFGLGADDNALPTALPAEAGADFLSVVKTLPPLQTGLFINPGTGAGEDLEAYISTGGASTAPDATKPVADPQGRVGWYFSKAVGDAAGKKFHWYYMSNCDNVVAVATANPVGSVLPAAVDTSATLGALANGGGMYALVTVDTATHLIMVAYTYITALQANYLGAPMLGMDVMPGFARSRRVWSANVPAGATKVLLTVGTVPADVHPEAARVPLALSPSSSAGPLSAVEIISSAAISSNSSDSTGALVVHSVGFFAGDLNFERNLVINA